MVAHAVGPTGRVHSHPEESAAVEAREVFFSYGGARPVLNGVSLTAPAGQVTMILGASGSGKTTLLKVFKGLLRPLRGSVTVLGRPVFAAGRAAGLDPTVAYIPQQLGLVRNFTVLENTLTGALSRMGTISSLFKVFPRKYVVQARETLEALGIGHKAEERVFSLSGGERQRVAIARALMQEPRLILADEFISQLDPVTSWEAMDIMQGITQRGVALVMTTHELDIVARYAERVVVLRQGEKVMDCPTADARVEELGLIMKTASL